MAKSYAFSNAHTHTFGKTTDRAGERAAERGEENLHNGSQEERRPQCKSEPHRKIQPYRIASHSGPKRTGLKRSIAQFMQIQSQSLAALLVAFYDGLHEMQVLARGAGEGVRKGVAEREGEHSNAGNTNGNRWQHVVRV